MVYGSFRVYTILLMVVTHGEFERSQGKDTYEVSEVYPKVYLVIAKQ